MDPPISSRTPEGRPGCCPVCGAEVRVEPSWPMGDAPCPACGVLLWFVATSAGVRLHRPKGDPAVREKIQQIFRRRTELGPMPAGAAEGEESQLIELVMLLEDRLDVQISDEEAAGIRTVGDALDCILRRI